MVQRIVKLIRFTPYVLVFGGLLVYIAYYYAIPRRAAGHHVSPSTATLEIAGPGLLDARNKVTVSARVQGYLRSIAVDRNDTVSIDQVLAQLESEELFNQLAAARADAESAERAVAEARSEQDRSKAVADKARADLERRRDLALKHIITEADWVATEAAFRQAQAELARSGTAIEGAIARAAAAAANVKVLQARLNDATIRSPLNGVVVMRDRNVGDLLSPGTSLMQLVDPRTIIVSARFDESAMGAIDPGLTAKVRFASVAGADFKGSVLRLIRQVDQETREFAVDIALETLPPHWALGQRANVIVEVPSPPEMIAIPQSLVVRQSGRVGAWMLQNGRAQWVPLTLGYPAGGLVEVLKGLHEGDVVLAPEGRYWLEPIAGVEGEQ
ncbi:HlyD family secretion protein [Rhizobiales bacterium GAS191]|nr:HlyD family secretion protein [Rhizobiales bacterium GAS113]SEC08593.1 HlyD family secretion protein [Rhizobiales bacterium GAS191]